MRKELIGAVAWAVFMMTLAFGASVAHKLGYIDGDTATRLAIGVTGLWLAWYGNRIPKAFAPNACARQAQRVTGWSLVLSSLVYIGLWVFAPMPIATWGGPFAILAGVALAFVYCLSLRSRARAS